MRRTMIEGAVGRVLVYSRVDEPNRFQLLLDTPNFARAELVALRAIIDRALAVPEKGDPP